MLMSEFEEIRKEEGDTFSFDRYDLKMRILRNTGGLYLCGYIAIPEGSPLYALSTSELEKIVEFHGGITIDEKMQKDNLGIKVGERLIGFDCNHMSDINPSKLNDYSYFLGEPKAYRDLRYVEEVLRHSAERLNGYVLSL